jgi:SNO glutamine amidotransferase family
MFASKTILASAEVAARAPAAPTRDVVIGVLALQGAFAEHVVFFRALGCGAMEVRTPEDLKKVDGLVIPGGESTAIQLIAKRTGMVRHSLALPPQSHPPTTPSPAPRSGMR